MPISLHPDAIRRRLNSGEWMKLRPGSFVEFSDLEPEERHRLLAMATATRIGPRTVLSHTTAALLHGIPVLHDRLDRVTAIIPAGNGKRSRYLHTRQSPLSDDDITKFELGEAGLVPVTSYSRTLRDLATTLPFGEAVAAFDAAAATYDVTSVLGSGPRAIRVELVREFADKRSESFGESMSRATFARAGIPAPEIQLEHFSPTGAFVARPDFTWGTVVGEFDGKVKYGSLLRPGENAADVVMREKRRDAALQDIGRTVIHWQWSELFPPTKLVARIARALGIERLTPRREYAW